MIAIVLQRKRWKFTFSVGDKDLFPGCRVKIEKEREREREKEREKGREKGGGREEGRKEERQEGRQEERKEGRKEGRKEKKVRCIEIHGMGVLEYESLLSILHNNV